MSKLFRTSLKKIFAEIDQAPPIEEWDRDGIAAMSLAVQIGILERLDVLVELQAMILGSGPTVPDSTVSKFLDRLNQHYGWKDNEGA